MQYVKILGLLAVAAAALLAFAVSASATAVTETTGGAATTPTIHWVNEGGHVTLQNPIANISCSSTVEGKVESHGSGSPASGNISTLNFTGCTNSWHKTTHPGKWTLEWITKHYGVTRWDNGYWTITRFGVTCVYETNNTTIGTVTGGNPATLHIEATIPINDPESGALCGTSAAKWEGNYVTTSALYVAP